MEQGREVLVSPIAEVPVVEGGIVTAIRELTNRGWGAKAIAAELAIARNTVRRPAAPEVILTAHTTIELSPISAPPLKPSPS